MTHSEQSLNREEAGPSPSDQDKRSSPLLTTFFFALVSPHSAMFRTRVYLRATSNEVRHCHMYLHHNFVFIGCGFFQWRVRRRRQSNVIRHAFASSIAQRSDDIGAAN